MKRQSKILVFVFLAWLVLSTFVRARACPVAPAPQRASPASPPSPPSPPSVPRTRLVRDVGLYKQIGIMSAAGQEPVPLYGRPTSRGDRWNYYAVSNQHVPQKLPVYKDRDCARMLGCAEASDGDTLEVRGYGHATVTLYTRDDADRYAV